MQPEDIPVHRFVLGKLPPQLVSLLVAEWLFFWAKFWLTVFPRRLGKGQWLRCLASRRIECHRLVDKGLGLGNAVIPRVYPPFRAQVKPPTLDRGTATLGFVSGPSRPIFLLRILFKDARAVLAQRRSSCFFGG